MFRVLKGRHVVLARLSAQMSVQAMEHVRLADAFVILPGEEKDVQFARRSSAKMIALMQAFVTMVNVFVSQA